MSAVHDRSPLAGGLARCISVCQATLAAYAEGGRADSAFARAILRTTAALEAALSVHSSAEELRLAAATARETAAAIRRHGLDERLLRCAEACERAAFLCEDVVPQAA